MASGHPLFLQWVINELERERERERERIINVEDLTWDSLVVELPPHVHLGGAITDISRTSGIPSWKRGLLQMDNINFVDVIWFGTLACIKFIVSLKKRRTFIREREYATQ